MCGLSVSVNVPYGFKFDEKEGICSHVEDNSHECCDYYSLIPYFHRLGLYSTYPVEEQFSSEPDLIYGEYEMYSTGNSRRNKLVLVIVQY